MDFACHAARTRAAIVRGECDPPAFRAALESIDLLFRDDWLDAVLDLGELPEDRDLPAGCVPYLPSPVDALARVVTHGPVSQVDTFVDVGAGVGRAALAMNLMSGAHCIAIEVQPQLVDIGRRAAAELNLKVEFVAADAVADTPTGDVYFLYCPFDAARVAVWVRGLELRPNTRIATLDVALPLVDGLARDTTSWGDLRIYRTT